MTAPAKTFMLDSFLSFLLEETVKADISMHNNQLEAWQHFSKYKPRGSHINQDIDEGWAQSGYLSLDSVSFKFYIRLVPDNFRTRLRQGLKYIFKRYQPQAYLAREYELSKIKNPDSIEVTVTVRQEEQGKMKISYEPVDDFTNSIFLTSPFLQNLQAV